MSRREFRLCDECRVCDNTGQLYSQSVWGPSDPAAWIDCPYCREFDAPTDWDPDAEADRLESLAARAFGGGRDA